MYNQASSPSYQGGYSDVMDESSVDDEVDILMKRESVCVCNCGLFATFC